MLTPDELKSMPKGQFVVMKSGFYPMKVKLKLFFKWGIKFDEDHPYTVPGQEQPVSEKNQPQHHPQDKGKRGGGTSLRTAPKSRRQEAGVTSDGRA